MVKGKWWWWWWWFYIYGYFADGLVNFFLSKSHLRMNCFEGHATLPRLLLYSRSQWAIHLTIHLCTSFQIKLLPPLSQHIPSHHLFRLHQYQLNTTLYECFNQYYKTGYVQMFLLDFYWHPYWNLLSINGKSLTPHHWKEIKCQKIYVQTCCGVLNIISHSKMRTCKSLKFPDILEHIFYPILWT